ncbi:uncharacterized protein MONBRDRAFT_10377, partial [Monosiga brevicollis MX1]
MASNDNEQAPPSQNDGQQDTPAGNNLRRRVLTVDGEVKYDEPPFKHANRDVITEASFVSYMLYAWCQPLVSYGRRILFTADDVFALPDEQNPEADASIPRVLFRCYKKSMLTAIFVATLFIIVSLFSPLYVLNLLIRYLQDNGAYTDSVGYGIGLAFSLAACEILRSLCVNMYWFSASRYAVSFRAIIFCASALDPLLFACPNEVAVFHLHTRMPSYRLIILPGAVYRKSLRLRDLGRYSVGELVNICSNDSQRVHDAAVFSAFIYIALVTGLAVMVSSSLVLGPAALARVFVFFLMIPIQVVFAKQTGQLRRKAMTFTDARVALMNEILSCIKLIKMYAWEGSFSHKVDDLRESEATYLRRAAMWQSITVSLVPVMPAVAALVTFLIQAYTEGTLKPDEVYTVQALFNVLRFSLAVLPMGVKAAAEAKQGVKRLKKFLLQNNERIPLQPPPRDDLAIEFVTADIAWPGLPPKPKSKAAAALERKNSKRASRKASYRAVDFRIKHGELVGCCGAVGAGKSTLLATLLAETLVMNDVGRAHIDGDVAYVSQQAWIQSSTLRDNILFGLPFNERLYRNVVFAAGLEADFRQLSAGDLTFIGERGLNLSGGQKQRVSLARALYANQDVYLLDDPLSAVDVHVGEHIFEYAICETLAEKTVLFVTHQLQHLSRCDRVLFLHGGRVHMGTYRQLMNTNRDFASLVEHHMRQVTDSDGQANHGSRNARHGTVTTETSDFTINLQDEPVARRRESLGVSPAHHRGSRHSVHDLDHEERLRPDPNLRLGDPESLGTKLLQEEDTGRGSVGGRTVADYFRAAGGIWLFSFIIFLFFVAMFARTFSDYYLSYWIRRGDGTSTTGSVADNPHLDTYALVFGMTVAALLVFQVVRGYMYCRQTIRAASAMHGSLFRAVVCAPMSFFDTTPTGRLLNRFSKDMDEVDT